MVKIVKAGHYSMAYDEAGMGVPVVFIHGYPLNRRIWAPQLHGLAGDAHILAPDLPGHGDSQALPGTQWISDLADSIDRFLNAAGIDRPIVLCGLSMGGYVAMAFYRQHGPRLAGLIFTATRAGADSEEARKKRDEGIQRARQDGTAAAVEGMVGKLLAPETYAAQPDLVDKVRDIMFSTPVDTIISDLQAMKQRPDSYPSLAEISVPTLVLHGEDDQIVPVDEAKSMQRAMHNARLVTIPGTGHLLNMEKPDEFNDAVRSFLATLV